MWEQIESNKRKSVLIVTVMGLILVGVGLAMGQLFTGHFQGALWGGAIAFGVWFMLWLFTRGQGDDVMLRMAGAREIKKQDHPQLFNVVEEMTIAAQLPKMPRVFIVDDPSPNAFAVGNDSGKASVAVTIGLLRILNRDELQGVVAHEIGHIKNRDVALMTTAGIMLGVIVILADLGMHAMWFGGGGRRSRNSGGGGGGGVQLAIMIMALIFMILSPILAQLVYFALSRRREYLADACGAMYTRWPEGLASALEKLGGTRTPQVDQNRVTAPMYIVRPLRQGEQRSLNSAFTTHPPLAERIKVLRGMGGNADFRAYDQAFSRATGKHVLGSRTLSAADQVDVRAPTSAAETGTPHQRLRQASNAFLSGAGYTRQTCAQCGLVLKIPPERRDQRVACPRCGKTIST